MDIHFDCEEIYAAQVLMWRLAGRVRFRETMRRVLWGKR